MKFSIPHVIIDLNAVKNNYLFLKKKVSPTKVAAMVKASSYGLGGQNKIVKKLVELGCKTFFVANINEGIKIRSAFKNVDINILNGLNKSEEKTFYKYNLNPVINSVDQFNKWIKFLKNKKKNNLTIQFDTGMCRLGIQEHNVLKVVNKINELKKFKNVLVMSHLACADNPKEKFNKIQLKRFENIKKLLPGFKYSLAASGGVFLGKKYHFDLVRPGINLYGGRKKYSPKIKHVVTLKAPIIQINVLKRGESVGYNRTFIAKKDMTTATIPMGYADGIGLRLSNRGFVHFKNKKLPMLGRVSMDLIIIDISKVKNKIKIGDFVKVYDENFTIDNFATLSETIPYRVITCISQRYHKKYIN
jgi:alanine racemase